MTTTQTANKILSDGSPQELVELAENFLKMKDACVHAYRVFQSLSNRGLYPQELLPFDSTKVGPEAMDIHPLFMGIQGFSFLSEPIMTSEGIEYFNQFQEFLNDQHT